MMRSATVLHTILGAVLVLNAAQAQANWQSQAEIGAVMSRGNSDTQTGNAKMQIVRQTDRTKHDFGASGLYGETKHDVTAQRWDVRFQTDLTINEKSFWFGNARYQDDEFSGFDFQGSTSTGFGYAFFDSQDTILRAQLGLGYRVLRPEQLVKDENDIVIGRIQGETGNDATANGAVKFEHSLNDATRVVNNFLVEAGQDNTAIQNDLALQVRMTEVFALSVGFSVRNNSNPPSPLSNTDTLTTLNLVYQSKR